MLGRSQICVYPLANQARKLTMSSLALKEFQEERPMEQLGFAVYVKVLQAVGNAQGSLILTSQISPQWLRDCDEVPSSRSLL